MLSRLNAVTHAVSAIYAAVVVGLAAFMFQPLASSHVLYGLGLIGVASIGVLDATAAIKQWKRPPSGRLLSIFLHLVVAVTVFVILLVAYSQSQQGHSLRWFVTHDFVFVICLALLRLGLAAALLRSKGM